MLNGNRMKSQHNDIPLFLKTHLKLSGNSRQFAKYLNRPDSVLAEGFTLVDMDGYMVFTALSKEAHTYGQGKFVSKDRYELFGGVNMFFYDIDSVHAEFDNAGLFEITEIEENYPFFLITCQKGRT